MRTRFIEARLEDLALKNGYRLRFRRLNCGSYRIHQLTMRGPLELWTGSLIEAYTIAKGGAL